MTISLSGTNGITFPDNSLQTAAASPYVLKNRLINADMRIDQRNAGASVTNTAGAVYSVDRWRLSGDQASKFTAQQSTTAPTGFVNSLLITSSSAYTVGTNEQYTLMQRIEGLNVADLGWGTASAQTVTLSFWVRSSLTGTFGGSFRNSAADRSYPFTYTISVANTWEQKTVTVSGDTSGTWLTTSGIGVMVSFCLGGNGTALGTAGAWGSNNNNGATGSTNIVSTNGATFYITGVQLEIGTSATPFERRLYNQELANCQRYCPVLSAPAAANKNLCLGMAYNTTVGIFQWQFPVQARTSPTGISVTGTYTFYQGETAKSTLTPTFNTGTVEYGSLNFSTTGLTAASCLLLTNDSNTSKIVFNGCEL